MTLQDNFTQTKVATITLGDKAHIGCTQERDGLRIAPGDYHVFEVRDSNSRALMFAQTGDFYTNISSMDIAKLQSSDGASYGIADGDDAYKQGYDDMWNHDDVKNSYVAPTNDGDSDYVVCSNKDRTAFLLDDENIYLKYLLQYKDAVDAQDAYKGLYGFDINFNKRRIDMVYDGEQSYITANDGERIIDALAEAVATRYEARCLEGIEDYGMEL